LRPKAIPRLWSDYLIVEDCAIEIGSRIDGARMIAARFTVLLRAQRKLVAARNNAARRRV
jgi:hypothetical protein